MPQLMPLNWMISSMMLCLIFMMLVLMYSGEKKDFLKNLFKLKNEKKKWSW